MSTAEQEEERTGCQAVSLVLHDASQNTIETKEKRGRMKTAGQDSD